MDYETVDAADFGASLRGLGINILCHDLRATARFLEQVFDMQAHRLSDDFAIMTYGSAVFQLHQDTTYTKNPLLNLLPENPPRGAGVEIRLYDTDPDIAAARAESAGGTLLQPATDKPHGLREAYILDPDGYAWVPSRPL
ncbi:VOC family protein [Rhodobacteraceae bacterium D3-12]|nr:VOC family protein [Rhodobacteraceae bacterium D3-12]